MASAILAVGATLSITASAGVANASATAFPSGCRYVQFSNTQADAACSNANGGSWRAVAVCRDAELSRTVYRYGPWRYSSGQRSTAYCQGAERILYPGITTRA
jgi:hypothetical protein